MAELGDGPKVCGLGYTLWDLSSPALQDSLLEDLLEDVKHRTTSTARVQAMLEVLEAPFFRSRAVVPRIRMLIRVKNAMYTAKYSTAPYGMLKNNALLTAGVLCLAEAALQLCLLAGYFLWRRRAPPWGVRRRTSRFHSGSRSARR